jgi:hypothetical protein
MELVQKGTIVDDFVAVASAEGSFKGDRVDGFVKSQETSLPAWFDTCLTDGRQASP